MGAETMKRYALRTLCVLAIAVIMSAIGVTAWNSASFQDQLGLMGSPLGDESLLSYFMLAPISCLTWLILGPFLNGRRIWAVVPVGVISPFLGSAILTFIIFFWNLLKGPMETAVHAFTAGWVTFFAWSFIVISARVTLPVGLATAVLIWVTFNRLLPHNHALDRPAAR